MLLGAFQVSPTLTIIAAIGLVLAAAYALRLIQRTFHGANTAAWHLPDLTLRDMAVMALLIASLVWLGLFPQPILDTVDPVLRGLRPTAIRVHPRQSAALDTALWR